MEKKNNIGNGILVVLLFVVVCFLFYYIVVANKGKNNNVSDEPIIEDKVNQRDTNDNYDDVNDNTNQEFDNANSYQVKDLYDYNAGYVLDDNNIKFEIELIMEKYYTTVDFNIKCGEKDMEDVYYPNEGSIYPDYIRCLEYNNVEDLKKYYNSFLSENFYSKMVELSFIEHDNKLYCLVSHTAPYTYERGSFDVGVVKKNEDIINATGVYKTEENGLYPEYTFDVKMRFVYSDNHLVLDKYYDEMRND